MVKPKLSNLLKWQNYVHYLILTLAIFYIHFLSDIWGVEALVINRYWYGWFALFGFYALSIFIADTLIHFIFSILPEPYKWED